MNRRLSRLRAIQALYQMDIAGADATTAMENALDDGEEISPFMNELVLGTVQHQSDLDKLFSSHLQGWTIDRIGKVDRAILRMALYELNFVEDIPKNVSFNEAIELAKAFGGEEAGKFVNGVLSKAIDEMKK